MPYGTLPEERIGSNGQPFVGLLPNPIRVSTIYQDFPSAKFPVFQNKSDALVDLTKEIEKRFQELLSEWESATAYSSILGMRVRHPAFRSIVELGMPVVPLIFNGFTGG
jgi:hypothetical protein